MDQNVANECKNRLSDKLSNYSTKIVWNKKEYIILY